MMPKDIIYLSVSLPFGRRKKENFQFLIHRMHKKVHHWRDSLLTKARKLVMLKAVLQSLSLYTMSCLQVPKSIFAHLTRCVRDFWWSQDLTFVRIRWMDVVVFGIWFPLIKLWWPNRLGGLFVCPTPCLPLILSLFIILLSHFFILVWVGTHPMLCVALVGLKS